jgi:hypothetical protein
MTELPISALFPGKLLSNAIRSFVSFISDYAFLPNFSVMKKEQLCQQGNIPLHQVGKSTVLILSSGTVLEIHYGSLCPMFLHRVQLSWFDS